MDRFLECRRVCLRPFGEVEGGSLLAAVRVVVVTPSKGRDFDVESCEGKGRDGGVDGVSEVNGKDEARGEGWGGANGPETDRVRLWLW